MSEENADLAGKATALEGELLDAGDGPQTGAGDAPSAAPEQDLPSSAELLTLLLVPTFKIMAPNWEVSDAECALLGDAYVAVIDKYFPDFSMGVELTAVLATLTVFGPRINQPMKAPSKKSDKSESDGEEKKPA